MRRVLYMPGDTAVPCSIQRRTQASHKCRSSRIAQVAFPLLLDGLETGTPTAKH